MERGVRAVYGTGLENRPLVETANTALDEDYAAQTPDVAGGDYVMLAVTDTGKGIPSDVPSKVFEPSFTTKESDKETGLGLSIVYGFINQSGGHIRIYSEVGRGTTRRSSSYPEGGRKRRPALSVSSGH